jgi:cytochrome c553
MHARREGNLQELLPVFAPNAVVAAVLICALGAPAFAQSNAQPAPATPLMPIALEGNADRGAVLAETCKGCHGIPGYFNATPAYHVPKLGGQNADYIEVALQGYRRGTRGHVTMQAQASSLTDQDIADVAAYFATYEGDAEVGRTKASAAMIEAGRTKAATCVACHGQEGVAGAPQWPNLAGQHESYLLEALGQYKNGDRVDLVMNPLAQPLDEESIEELAAFFASQPHLHNTPIMPN